MMNNKGEFGFSLKLADYKDLTVKKELKATVELNVEECDNYEIVFNFEELTHYDNIYKNAMKIVFDDVIKELCYRKYFTTFKVSVNYVYWFDLQSSPPIAVAYSFWFALINALDMSVMKYEDKPYFDIEMQTFVFPTIISENFTFKNLEKYDA